MWRSNSHCCSSIHADEPASLSTRQASRQRMISVRRNRCSYAARGTESEADCETKQDFTADPPLGTFGTLGRNAIYGPRFWNVDFAVAKSVSLTEKLALQLRAEIFNIFNHPNFALPNF